MKKDLTKLVIDRQKWLRGSSQDSVLRNEEGSMCCLGFRALQCGYTEDQIINHATPQSTAFTVFLLPEFEDFVKEVKGSFFDTQLTIQAMRINDDNTLTEETRERRLSQLFAEHGITVIFEN